MSNFTGMDIAAVRTLSKQLQTRADEIRNITQQLTGQLNSTPWVGPDREQSCTRQIEQFTGIVVGVSETVVVIVEYNNRLGCIFNQRAIPFLVLTQCALGFLAIGYIA